MIRVILVLGWIMDAETGILNLQVKCQELLLWRYSRLLNARAGNKLVANLTTVMEINVGPHFCPSKVNCFSCMHCHAGSIMPSLWLL